MPVVSSCSGSVITFLVIASAGGSALTDLQQPANTVIAAVMTIFTLVGTGATSGSSATIKSAAWASKFILRTVAVAMIKHGCPLQPMRQVIVVQRNRD